MSFMSIIITAKEPRHKEYTTPSMTFEPKVINLSKRNADETIDGIRDKLSKGEAINELELIYLPLYSSPSGKGLADLVDTAIKLTGDMPSEQESKKKIFALLFLLTAKDLSDEELNKIWEANAMALENNNAVRFVEKRGRDRGIEEAAIRFLKKGYAVLEIAETLDLSVDIVEDLKLKHVETT